MRSRSRWVWLGLSLHFLAVVCFAIVFGQLYAVERADVYVGSILFDTFEARLAQRWIAAGVVLLVIGTAFLARAAIGRSTLRGEQ